VFTDEYVVIDAFDQKFAACRNALFLTDPHVDRERLINMKGMRVTGTCRWITQKWRYQSWLHGSTHLLWISGDPGTGKTMLSIFLTEELERVSQQKRHNAELLFFFCSHQDEKLNTAVAILRGLLYQIVVKRPKLIKHVLPYLETPERAQLTLSSLETLWITFRRVIQDVDLGKMFCVLDGLDECDADSTSLLVAKLVELFTLNDSQITNGAFKIVIVSRNIPGLRSCTQVKFNPDNEEHVVSDIKRFISVRVKELSRIEGFNEDFRIAVRKTLLERSEGTFLWVGLVMRELSQKRTCTEVLEALRELSPDLSEIYGRMLLQIESRRRRTSSGILLWVMMAIRPLTLQELAAAIGIQSSALITIEQAVRDQVALCGPFLKLRDQEVGLVHQSARDYLLRKEPDSDSVLEDFRIKPEEAHLELARTCFDCIEHSALQYRPLDFDNGSCSQEPPLLKYAALYWPEHARCCSTRVIELFNLSESLRSFFQTDSSLRKNWWETYTRAKPWPRLSAPPVLHIACSFGIVPWVRALLSETWMSRFHKLADKQDENGQTALHWAARGGYKEVVHLLLDRGADVSVKNNDGLTALEWAALREDKAMVQLLLNRGADVNLKHNNRSVVLDWMATMGYELVVQPLLGPRADINVKSNDGQLVLHMVALVGYEAMVRLLLDHGADVNAKDNYGWTALHIAALKGHEAVVRLLLERKADVNAKGNDGWTPLHSATCEGHMAVVQLLLGCGADVNAEGTGARTALHSAAAEGHEAVVQLLLDRSADINVESEYERTALDWAAFHGRKAVVQLLLDHGADVNAKGSGGRTALHWAAAGGHEAVVQLLLDHGADVKAKDNDGRTALNPAARQENEAVVRLLLGHGVDVKEKDEYGLTALHGAADQGHESVVQLLLDHGADVKAKGNDGLTALHWAAAGGHEAVVRLLLARGADVNAKDNKGWTALDRAAHQGCKAVVRLLKSVGASRRTQTELSRRIRLKSE